MIIYERVKSLSDEMIVELAEMKACAMKFKSKTSDFSDTLGDKISNSAFSISEDITRIIGETESIIRQKTTNVGDFAQELKRVEDMIKSKVDNI
ncbi:MAG: hypothetical protein IKD03_03725 [Clostridia bacterium]|nr:hypothetical protein [Clostridia bacterium]